MDASTQDLSDRKNCAETIDSDSGIKTDLEEKIIENIQLENMNKKDLTDFNLEANEKIKSQKPLETMEEGKKPKNNGQTYIESDSSHEQFLQAFSTFFYQFTGVILPFIGIFILSISSYYSTFCMVSSMLYILWILWDIDTPKTTGRRWKWFRDLTWWKYHKAYYPITVHKTAELPPDKNYLMAALPHGVLSTGVFSTFGTNAHNMDVRYPGIKFFVATLSIVFYAPFSRDLLLWAGVITSHKRSLYNFLGSKNSGNAVALVVGGAAEAYYNNPGEYKVLVKRRRGFCRIAIETGASIVPVLCLGEPDLFDVKKAEPGTLMYRFQELIKRVTGVYPAWFIGSSLGGFMARRKPVHVIVGAPINVKKKSEISESEVAKLHDNFIYSLEKLFQDNKHYLENPDVELEFV